MSRITPYQMDMYTVETINLYRALEVEIFKQIARRLKKRGTGDILQWQIERMNELGMLNKQVIKELSVVSGVASHKIEQAITQAGYSSIRDIDGEFAGQFDIKPLPTNLDQIMRGYRDQTFLDIDNFVNQTLISTNFQKGTMAKVYEDIISQTTAKFISGTVTFEKALEQTIFEWADKGVPSTFVDKGGHTWSLERYADTVLKSTLNRTYNDIRTNRMSEHGVTTVIMSTVYDAASRCAYCQGKILDMRPVGENDSKYHSIYEYGYGFPGGTLGINCRHSIHPFVPGVNVNNLKQIDPKESVSRSKEREKQRVFERRIRSTKKKIIIAEELGSTSLDNYKQLLRKQQAQMREHLQGAKWLTRDYHREKVITARSLLMNGVSQNAIIKSKLNVEKFNRHYKGTKEYNDYLARGTKTGSSPSYMTVDLETTQYFIDKVIELEHTSSQSKIYDFNHVIGIYVDQITGREYKTTRAKVHFSKTGAHIVPTRPRKGDKYGI